MTPEHWDQTPPAVQASIRMLEARVETMASMVHSLQEQLQTLQEQLHQTPQHASRPPASEPPQHARPGHSQRPRRRGGPPGHPGHPRPLIPLEDVDEVVGLTLTPGTHCQAPFAGDAPKPWRHQVLEIPPLKPVVTASPWPPRACPACGERTRAPWPAGGFRGTYGPRVQALGALETGADHWSQRTTQHAMAEGCGVPRRVGTLRQLEQATPEAVAAPVEEARPYGPAQAVAHRDETSGRQGAKRAW